MTENSELEDILQRDLTSKYLHRYVNIDGVTMPDRYVAIKQAIHDWEVNEDDVWLCSFPKTGTTWAQQMIWLIMNNLDFIGGNQGIVHRSPFLEMSAVFDFRQLLSDAKFKIPPALEDSLTFTRECSKNGPTCIKTHLPWILLPKEITEGIKKPKIIYVSRNPKDTCVSYFHHTRLLDGNRGSFQDFCRLFLGGKVMFAPFWDHVLPFWMRRNQSNILFLKYEDMIKDLPSIIREVSKFLGKTISEEQVELLAENLSFKSMKENPGVNLESGIRLRQAAGFTCDQDGTFIRSGKVGGFKEKMTDDIIRKFDDWTETNITGNGLSF